MVNSRASFVKSYPCGSVPVGKSSPELPKGNYAARVAWRHAAAKGPSGDGPGGLAIRPGRCAKLPHWRKRWARYATRSCPRNHGYRGRTDQVVGEVAWTQRPKTLTDESPTSSRVSRVTPAYKSLTKGPAQATARRSRPRRLRLRDRSSPGVVAPGDEREDREEETTAERTMRAVSRIGCGAKAPARPLSGNRAQAKKHFPRPVHAEDSGPPTLWG